MKNKLSLIKLPLIQPDKRTHHNFFSVCIKAIENNRDGVIDKNECINNIIKLKEEKIRLHNKKFFSRTTFLNFNPSKTSFKMKTQKIINKRRTLSEILSEAQKLEDQSLLKRQVSYNQLDIDNQKGKSLNKRKSRENSSMKVNNANNKKSKRISLLNTNKNMVKNKKEKGNRSLPQRNSLFQKINEYLESNNLALFELTKHNPFQTKPYQISKGYEFLEAVKFKNYVYVREALQTSNDFLFVFDYYGQTCYHWAAKLGNIKMLRLLLDYGKYHNQKDFKGRTPLYLAAVNNNREICDLLLRHKANIHLKDKSGNSAADVAGSKELKYYLGDCMIQPFSNPLYKKKVEDYHTLRKEMKKEKKLKKNDDENNNDDDEEKNDLE